MSAPGLPSANPSWWTRRLPVLDWLPRYPKSALRPDIVAGLTSAAIVIPQAMAYAAIAGLPIQVGIYAALVPALIYVALGTSRVLSISTTSTIAVLTAAALADAVPSAIQAQLLVACATLSLLVGLILVAAAVLRLGVIANFISDPVLSGFKAGVGLVIVVSQLPKMMGVQIHASSFFGKLAEIVVQVPNASLATLAFALATLFVCVSLGRLAPRLPASLIALLAAICASAFLNVRELGIALVGEIPSGLPRLEIPSLALVWQLAPAAGGIALMSFVESVASARAFVASGDPRPDAEQDLLALGSAGVVGSLFGAMPAGGGTSQTAVNRKAGAKTQVASLVTAVIAGATLLFFAPVIELLPQAALAAVVIVATSGLLDASDFQAIRRVRKEEFWWAIVALIGVPLFGTLNGVLVAILASMLTLLYEANHPPVYVIGRKPGTNLFRPLSNEHPGDETQTGLLILRLEGRLYFGNAHSIGDKIWKNIHSIRPRVVILDCSAVIDIEFTALKMLIGFINTLRSEGVDVWMARLEPSVLDVIRRSDVHEILTDKRLFQEVELAVEAYLRLSKLP